MRLFVISALTVLSLTFDCFAGSCNQNISALDTFPCDLDVSGRTYTLTENISCDGTCFVVKSTNITFNGNGNTITFNNANNSDIPNNDFENWTDANTPISWSVLSGTATRADAHLYGNYDLILSPTGVIKSSGVTLRAGKTYIFYAAIKGYSADSYTITVHKVSDDSQVAATSTLTGDILARVQALPDGKLWVTEQEYKPSADTDVYLKITCFGDNDKRFHRVAISPVKDFGFVGYAYNRTSLSPDVPIGGGMGGFSLSNVSIIQGAGNGAKCAAVAFGGGTYSTAFSNIDVSLHGASTYAIASMYADNASFVVDDVDVISTSDIELNRMNVTGIIGMVASNATTSVTSEIKNCNISGHPQYAININGYYSHSDTGKILIHNNALSGSGTMTEAYAIRLNNTSGVEIYDNTINPSNGRGILLDAAGDTNPNGTYNTKIYRNNITVIEGRNAEYAAGGLETPGIRIRNWGGAAEEHSGLDIYENIITSSTTADLVHAAFGININAASALDDIDIHNNVINVSQSYGTTIHSDPSESNGASGIILQTPVSGSIRIYNNDITSNDRGVRFGGSDGLNTNGSTGMILYSNKISSTGGDAIAFHYQGTHSGHEVYCNQIVYSEVGGPFFPFYLNGAISDILIDYNHIENSNSGGYEAWADANESTDILFYGNGTIDVAGGGSVGAAASATNGSVGCYSTAGADFVYTPPSIGKRYRARIAEQ